MKALADTLYSIFGICLDGASNDEYTGLFTCWKKASPCLDQCWNTFTWENKIYFE